MEPTQELIDDIYAEKVLRARKMSLDQKLLGGATLFEFVRTVATSGIVMQNPNATPEQVRREFQRRLKISRMLDTRP